MSERGDAGISLLFLLIGLLVVPAAIFSEGIQNTTAEAVLYVTAIGLALGIYRALRRYIIKPVAAIVEHTSEIPAMKHDIAQIKKHVGLDPAPDEA